MWAFSSGVSHQIKQHLTAKYESEMSSCHHRYISKELIQARRIEMVCVAGLRSVESLSHEVTNTEMAVTGTRATNGSGTEPLLSVSGDVAATERQIVPEMTGIQNDWRVNCREETGMAGKHVITATFTGL
jgi:hypothetical protein